MGVALVLTAGDALRGWTRSKPGVGGFVGAEVNGDFVGSEDIGDLVGASDTGESLLFFPLAKHVCPGGQG